MLIGLVYISLIQLNRLSIKKYTGNYVAFALLGVFLYQLSKSQNQIAAVPYFILMLFNLMLFVTTVSKLDINKIKGINENIYVAGVLIYFIGLIVFSLTIVLDGENILADSSMWEPEGFSIYEVLFGEVIAFQGFVGDPNLVGPGAAIFLYIGLSLRYKKYDSLRHIGNGILFIAIFVSASRGAFLALIIGLFAPTLFNKDSSALFPKVLKVVCSVGGLAVLSEYIDTTGNPLAKVEKGADRRFLEWGKILEGVANNPWFGNGLGYNKMILGKQSENGYLNLISETGFVGTAIFILLTVYVIMSFKKHVNNPGIIATARPWMQYLLFMLAAMMYTSSEVSANYWIALSILAAASFSAVKSKETTNVVSRVSIK